MKVLPKKFNNLVPTHGSKQVADLRRSTDLRHSWQTTSFRPPNIVSDRVWNTHFRSFDDRTATSTLLKNSSSRVSTRFCSASEGKDSKLGSKEQTRSNLLKDIMNPKNEDNQLPSSVSSSEQTNNFQSGNRSAPSFWIFG